jgi:GT2 family glycosyltransferase
LANQNLEDCEILVCDDGSTTSFSTSDLPKIGKPVTLLRQSGQGPSSARNYLARIACADYLFFVDADTVPRADMLEQARRVIAREPGIEAFYGSYDDDPWHRTIVSSYKNLLHHHTHHQSAGANQKITTFWCGCGVIDRKLYLEMGGLSEFYDKPSIEDIELGYRLSLRGLPIRIVPEMQVKHLKRWTLRSWLYTDAFRRGVPWIRLMRATGNWSSQLNFSWSRRLASMAIVVFLVCTPLTVTDARFAAAGIPALAFFVATNLDFFALVRRRRGALFSMVSVPLHIIYTLVCLFSFGAGFLYPPLRLPPTPSLQPMTEPAMSARRS